MEDLTIHFFGVMEGLIEVVIVGLLLREAFLLCLVLSHGVTERIQEGFVLRGDSRLANVFG